MNAKEIGRRLAKLQLKESLLSDSWSKINQVFVDERRSIEAERAKVRSQCRHQWEHVSDPAGDDGHDECKVCGAEK